MVLQVNRTLFLLCKLHSGEDAAWGWYLWAAHSLEQLWLSIPGWWWRRVQLWSYSLLPYRLVLKPHAAFWSAQAPLCSGGAPWLQGELCLQVAIWWDSRPRHEDGLRALLKKTVQAHPRESVFWEAQGCSSAKWFIQPFAITRCRVEMLRSAHKIAVQKGCPTAGLRRLGTAGAFGLGAGGSHSGCGAGRMLG